MFWVAFAVDHSILQGGLTAVHTAGTVHDGDDSGLFEHIVGWIAGSADEMRAAGLYTEDAIRNLHVGPPLIAVDPAKMRAMVLRSKA
ncbi:MAG: hypothetical protein MUF04_01235 [Akkermansiaceae bacterium]|jgi:hypothetical protein|nr:hypothetical protein [Akkermansiaceae bacterium]